MMEAIWPETASLAEFSPDESISAIQYISHGMNFEGETGWLGVSCGKYIRIISDPLQMNNTTIEVNASTAVEIEQRTSSLVARYTNEWLFWQFWTGSSSWVVFISRCFWVMFNSSSWDMIHHNIYIYILTPYIHHMIYTIYTPYWYRIASDRFSMDGQWVVHCRSFPQKKCWSPDGTYICYQMLPTLP